MDNLPLPFQPAAGLFFWTIIVFVGLLFLLKMKVFPPLVQMTVDRETAINKQLAEAERMRTEAAQLLQEHKELLASGRGEATAIIAEARQAAERERMLGIEKTRQEQDDLLASAKHEIAAERERALSSIRREAVDIAIAAAGKVVGGRLDAAADRKLVEEYIASLSNGAGK